ncbi:MAG: hypothetical protein RLZZ401_2308 [Pseudomonadota bacterium]|jgi:cytochrome c553
MNCGTKHTRALALSFGMVGMAVNALAQDAAAMLHVRATAAACATCHGTQGKTVDGSSVPALAGMPRDHMLAQMKAFKDGSRPATVMHQLSKGLTDQQIDVLATYFSTIQR